VAATLSKSERLCGKKAIAGLMEHGRGGSAGCLRYKYLKAGDAEVTRILVSVPKRHFKRAVKRNLLKRRIRESYRLQKDLLPVPVDLAFLYQDREVRSYDDIFAAMTEVLSAVAAKTG
jgi:ribonuclease P protein component